MCTVHALQVEIGELKGRLTEVISNCDALCKRIASEGPESLRSSVTPFSANLEISRSSSSPVQRLLDRTLASSEPKEDWLEWHTHSFPTIWLLVHRVWSLGWRFDVRTIVCISGPGEIPFGTDRMHDSFTQQVGFDLLTLWFLNCLISYPWHRV